MFKAVIGEQGQIAFHAQRGALFENLVVTEFLKGRFNRGQQADLYFWRDSKGLEVDLLLDAGMSLTPVEIKSGQTIAADSHIALKKWCELSGTTDIFQVWITFCFYFDRIKDVVHFQNQINLCP